MMIVPLSLLLPLLLLMALLLQLFMLVANMMTMFTAIKMMLFVVTVMIAVVEGGGDGKNPMRGLRRQCLME